MRPQQACWAPSSGNALLLLVDISGMRYAVWRVLRAACCALRATQVRGVPWRQPPSHTEGNAAAAAPTSRSPNSVMGSPIWRSINLTLASSVARHCEIF